MTRASRETGYSLVDVIMGLALFSIVLLPIYRVYGLTFALDQHIYEQLAVQQDVRLALDRVARALHETSTAYGRLRVYPPEEGCAGIYEGCLGFVTARDGDCAGTFHVIDGRADWQATLYLWRDTAASELRLRCDTGTALPATRWPPRTLEGFRVIARHVVAISVTLQPTSSSHPASIAIALQEQAPARRGPSTVSNETMFLPQNR